VKTKVVESAVAFTNVQRGRNNTGDDDNDEMMKIPERPSLEELKEERIDKLEEMQTELNDNMMEKTVSMRMMSQKLIYPPLLCQLMEMMPI
jgi:hypothetical protein